MTYALMNCMVYLECKNLYEIQISWYLCFHKCGIRLHLKTRSFSLLYFIYCTMFIHLIQYKITWLFLPTCFACKFHVCFIESFEQFFLVHINFFESIPFKCKSHLFFLIPKHGCLMWLAVITLTHEEKSCLCTHSQLLFLTCSFVFFWIWDVFCSNT